MQLDPLENSKKKYDIEILMLVKTVSIGTSALCQLKAGKSVDVMIKIF